MVDSHKAIGRYNRVVKRILRWALNLGALGSAALAVTLLSIFNAGPIHIHNERVWIVGQTGYLFFQVPQGSGFRTVFDQELPVFLLLLPLPVYWLRLRWSEYARTPRPGPLSLRFSIALILVLDLVWPLVMAIHGPHGIPGRFAIGMTVFIILSVFGVSAFFLLRLFAFVGDHLVRKRRARLAENRCAECGYLLVGNLSGVCPECGQRAVLAKDPAHA